MGELLDQIDSPDKLKNLSWKQLNQLAAEIRELITETVSQTGGHFAPNLGVVELTIALHYVLDSPRDKIVWDTGHQCYTHKLLTGRRRLFHTLRQYGGIAGFPRREESPHDIFDSGHGSNSISVALGLAKARDLKGGKETIVAVIGDGALTGGLALEGLNQAGHLQTRLIVLLNDNELSYVRTVGAISGYLSKMRSDPTYLRMKEDFEHIVRRLPLGTTLIETVERFKDSVKQLLVPGMLFEELGFTYLGPIDGHNIREVAKTLKRGQKIKGPVFIHVITKKGKGYKLAERDAARFHGVSPFDLKTGAPTSKGAAPTYTAIFGQALIELAKEDERIVAITAAMPEGTGLDKFAKEFPDRFFDVGMAEEHAVTFAAGLALEGFKPVVAIYSTFLQRAYDEILHDVCLQNLPVVFALDRGGIVGADGPTHQGIFDFSYLRHMPNIAVMAPKDENELRDMLKTAILSEVPMAMRYPRGNALGVPLEEMKVLDIGKGELLREGKDIALIAIGSMVYPALRAADILADKGIEAAVVNARFVKPLDEGLIIDLARDCPQLVTIEENVLQGGFGSAVLELLERRGIENVKVKRLGLPDKFIEHGAPQVLLEKYGLVPEKIAEGCLEILNLSSKISVIRPQVR